MTLPTKEHPERSKKEGRNPSNLGVTVRGIHRRRMSKLPAVFRKDFADLNSNMLNLWKELEEYDYEFGATKAGSTLSSPLLEVAGSRFVLFLLS